MRTHLSIPPLALACLVGPAIAQAYVGPLPGIEAEPIAPGTTDTGPLARSTTMEPVDLRRPSGFNQVFLLQTEDPNASDLFARADGAVTALFSRSVYDRTGARIPPGTQFVIGDIPDWLARSLGLRRTGQPASGTNQSTLLDSALAPTRGLGAALVATRLTLTPSRTTPVPTTATSTPPAAIPPDRASPSDAPEGDSADDPFANPHARAHTLHRLLQQARSAERERAAPKKEEGPEN